MAQGAPGNTMTRVLDHAGRCLCDQGNVRVPRAVMGRKQWHSPQRWVNVGTGNTVGDTAENRFPPDPGQCRRLKNHAESGTRLAVKTEAKHGDRYKGGCLGQHPSRSRLRGDHRLRGSIIASKEPHFASCISVCPGWTWRRRSRHVKDARRKVACFTMPRCRDDQDPKGSRQGRWNTSLRSHTRFLNST